MAAPPTEQLFASEMISADGTGWDVGPSGIGFGHIPELHKADFKLVCASWRRANATRTPTNNFTVDVSAYTPRQSLVHRVQLVDVDIPNTQLLIEDAWSRLYFDVGQRVGPGCRAISLAAHRSSSTVSGEVVLPLPVDSVLGFVVLPDGWVRVFTHDAAPFPVHALAQAYAAVADSHFDLLWVLTGAAATQRIPLLPSNCRPGPSVTTFDVNDAALAASVTAAPSSSAIPAWVTASAAPDPTTFASLISEGLAWSINAACADGAYPEFQVSVRYNGVPDAFIGRVKACHDWSACVFSGELAAYMGLGRAVLAPTGRGVFVCAPQKRAVPAGTFAQLQCGDTPLQATLAQWVDAAFNAHVWPAFELQFSFVDASFGGGVGTIAVPPGVYDAAALTVALNVNPAVVVSFVTTPYPSFVFAAAADGVPLALNFLSCVVSSRLGFEPTIYGMAVSIASSSPVPHVPLVSNACSGCADTRPVPCRVRASLQAGSSSLLLRVQPLDALTTGTAALDGTGTALVLTGLLANANFIRPGDELGVLVPGGAPNFVAGIVTAHTLAAAGVNGSLTVQMYSSLAAFTPGSQVVFYVLPPPALVTYMQRGPLLECGGTAVPGAPLCQHVSSASTWGNTVDANTFGFQPWTYVSCAGGVLVSPGTLEVWQDSYILVVLSLGTGNAGIVYYPFQAPDTLNCMTVFAKVLRSSVFLRADFDRVFDHVFPGGGATLTSIGVALYNPNGTPYQTHGHAVSITLKCEAKASVVEWGNGHAVVPGTNPYPVAEPFARGSVLAGRQWQ